MEGSKVPNGLNQQIDDDDRSFGYGQEEEKEEPVVQDDDFMEIDEIPKDNNYANLPTIEELLEKSGFTVQFGQSTIALQA